MTTDDHGLTQAAEDALRAAADSLHEQLDALDAAVEYHEKRARELRDTRKRVARVEQIVSAPPGNGPGRPKGRPTSQNGKAAISAATKARHERERAAKLDRVRQLVLTMPPPIDISGVDLLAQLNEGLPPNDPKHTIGRQLVVQLCSELRDEGVLRLDRTANGGKAIYRLAVTA